MKKMGEKLKNKAKHENGKKKQKGKKMEKNENENRARLHLTVLFLYEALTGCCNQRHWLACRRCRKWCLCQGVRAVHEKVHRWDPLGISPRLTRVVRWFRSNAGALLLHRFLLLLRIGFSRSCVFLELLHGIQDGVGFCIPGYVLQCSS